jgi:hypothetical protein
VGFSYLPTVNTRIKQVLGVSLVDHSKRVIGTVSGGSGHLAPLVAEDGTIVLSANSTIWAYASTGVLRWSTLLPLEPLMSLSVSSYGDGIVYAPGGFGEIYALHLTNGTFLKKLAGMSLSGPVIVGPGGLVIVPCGQGGFFYGYSPDLRTRRWSTNNVNFYNWAAVNIVSGTPAVLYVGSCPSVVALNATDGSLLWTYYHGQSMFGQMTLTSEGALIFSAGRYLYKLVDVTPSPTATSSATRSPSRSVSSTRSASISVISSQTPTAMPLVSYSASVSAAAAGSVNSSIAASSTPTQIPTPTSLPSGSTSPSLSPPASATTSGSAAPSAIPSPSPSAAATASASASVAPPACYDTNMEALVADAEEPDPSAIVYQQYGRVVCSSANGQVLGVGAPDTVIHGMQSGAVVLFVSRQLAGTENLSLACGNHCQHDWVEVQHLDAGEDKMFGDAFGSSLAISADGSYIIVGAPGRTVRGRTRVGQAYGFRRNSWKNGWQLVDVFQHPWVEAGAGFGASVAVSANGNFVAIGAPGQSSPAVTGHVFVFVRQSGGWGTEVLTNSGAFTADAFGSSVAMSLNGMWLAVGSPGTLFKSGAVIMHRWAANLRMYVATTTLIPPFPSFGDAFGAAVAYSASGRVLIIGAPGRWVNGWHNMGAAYLFVNHRYSDPNAAADVACFKQLLPPPPCLAGVDDHSTFMQFGSAVAVSDTDCFVGAPGAPVQGMQARGVAFLYHGVSEEMMTIADDVSTLNATWPTITRYTPSLQQEVLSFGNDVSMDGSGHLLVVGAPLLFAGTYGASFAASVGEVSFDVAADAATNTLYKNPYCSNPRPPSQRPLLSAEP